MASAASARRAALGLGAAMYAATSAAAPISLNFSALGQSFEGIGALSGGGGVTRLLIDYPQDIQQDVWDILFKPGAGASLQTIKVEIGGDTQSTEGTEMSHEHYRGDLNCSRGYEWTVLVEAKKRNPDIRTYGLAWGVPGWIGDANSTGGSGYYSQDNLQYHVDWVYCANAVWGVPIDYMGIWNERGADPNWTKALRRALDAAGFQSTRIVSADTGWNDVVPQMAADPDYAAAVDIIGAHYPGAPPSQAFSFNKSLWASEMWDLGKVDDWDGATQLAVDLNNHALWGLSSSILWCLVYSWYAILPFSRVTSTNAGAGHSVLTAAEPWSGHYEINPTVYAMAHHTQFAKAGWTYLTTTYGGMGSFPGGGTYVTRVNTHTAAPVLEFSMTAHTIGASAPQPVTFQITGTGSKTLPTALHVWVTNETAYFQRWSDVTVAADGTFSLTLPPAAFISITTTEGQGAAVPSNPIPDSQAFPFPYADPFEGYAEQGYPRYFSDAGGIFQVMPLPSSGLKNVDGSAASGNGYYQVVTVEPIAWETNPVPYTLIGNFNGGANQSAWTDYTAAVDAAFDGSLGPNPGMVIAGVTQPCKASAASQQFKVVGGGGLSTPAKLQSLANPSMCLGVTGQTLYQGANDVGLVDCGSTRALTQSSISSAMWQLSPGGESQFLDTTDGQCLDVLSAGTTPGTRVITYGCKAKTDPTLLNQQWNVSVDANGIATLTSRLSGLCLDLETLQGAVPHVKIGMRINSYVRNGAPINGYTLYLYPSQQPSNSSSMGSWQLSFASTPLANGTTTMPIVAGQFYRLAVTAKGSSITASLNGNTLTTVATDSKSSYGMAAIGCGWHHAWFDNFAVQAA